MATGPEHYRKAEELISTADEWMDADLGWKAHLSAQERIDRRSADLAAAQVHATLALAGATAMATYSDGEMDARDYYAWHAVAGVKGEYAAADVDPVTGRDYAEEAWQRAEAEREGREETLAQQLRAVGAERAAQDAEAGEFHAQQRAAEAERNGEYFDAAEAADVRQIERELDVWAGDDSEALQQEAEDDARAERAAEARRAAEREAAQIDDAAITRAWAEQAELQAARDEVDVLAARENAEHDPRTCTECADQYKAEQAADRETRTDAEIAADLRSIFGEPAEGRDYHEMPGNACADDPFHASCTEHTCANFESHNSSRVQRQLDQMRAEDAALEYTSDEPMTNRDIDPDAHADPYLDKLGYIESEVEL